MGAARITSRGLLLLSGLVTLVLWQFPTGRLALYPFTLLATYAHEMGHGLTALALGGHFHSLRLFPDGAGVALNAVGSDFSRALVAAGGLLGPSVAGALLLILGRHHRGARWALFALSVLVGASVLLFVRGGFGITFVSLVAGTLLAISRLGSNRVAQLSLQFLSLQLGLALFKDLDYMFSASGLVGGRSMPSDTAAIAEVLLLPYWFWGGTIAVLSFLLLGGALWVALKPEPATKNPKG